MFPASSKHVLQLSGHTTGTFVQIPGHLPPPPPGGPRNSAAPPATGRQTEQGERRQKPRTSDGRQTDRKATKAPHLRRQAPEDDLDGAAGAHDRDLAAGPRQVHVGAQVLGGHDVVRAAVCLARDQRQLWHRRLRIRIQQPGKEPLRCAEGTQPCKPNITGNQQDTVVPFDIQNRTLITLFGDHEWDPDFSNGGLSGRVRHRPGRSTTNLRRAALASAGTAPPGIWFD
jgi:hypothetical protein